MTLLVIPVINHRHLGVDVVSFFQAGCAHVSDQACLDIRMIDAMIKPMAKTKLAFEDKDIYRKPKNKDNKLKLNKGKDNLEKVSLMMDRGEQWKLHSASVVMVLVPGD